MSVVLEIIRDSAPLLTLLVILVTLRGHRVTNASAAREKFEQARNEARMVILQPIHPDPDRETGQPDERVVLSLEVAGPSPIVQVESGLATESSPGIEQVRFETYQTRPVLKPEAKHHLLLLDETPQGKVFWRVTWEDRYGYVWSVRYQFETGPEGVRLVRPPNGRQTITTPTRWQKIRNTLLPYDNWSPRR